MKTVGLTMLLMATPVAAQQVTIDQIAKLPQDKVEQIKRDCAREYPTDYAMQVYCQDKQYQALQILIQRGIPRDGS